MTDFTAFNPNAFNNEAFQIEYPATVNDPQKQLDQGNAAHAVNVDLGPTLGLRTVFVKPITIMTDGNFLTLGPGDTIILVNTIPLVQGIVVVLPEVEAWLKEPHYNPYNNFDRGIWIKDFGYHAATYNIHIFPDTGQKIDGLDSFTIINDGELIRLYPLSDLTGWFVG